MLFCYLFTQKGCKIVGKGVINGMSRKREEIKRLLSKFYSGQVKLTQRNKGTSIPREYSLHRISGTLLGFSPRGGA